MARMETVTDLNTELDQIVNILAYNDTPATRGETKVTVPTVAPNVNVTVTPLHADMDNNGYNYQIDLIATDSAELETVLATGYAVSDNDILMIVGDTRTRVAETLA